MDTRPLRPSEADPRVEGWLEIATRGLADEACQRVREEIIDHVAESSAERFAEGADADAAVAAAVTALGDPTRAGRALRRANLSRSEAKIVGSLASPQPVWIVALHLLGIPAFVAVSAPSVDAPRERLLFLIGLIGITVGITARFWVARVLARRGSLRAALVADVFGPWLFYASLVIASRLIVQKSTRWDAAIYTGAFLVGALLVARIWPKLGRHRPRLS